MSKGFSGMPGNLQGLMKQAQKMQEQLQKTQEELKSYTCEGQAAGGMVKVTVDGQYNVVEILINPEVVNRDDVELLQDMIKAAINNAVEQIQAHSKVELSKVTGGMSIPGLF